MEQLNLIINNLECASCATAIEKTFKKFQKNNFLNFSIILNSKKLKINFDSSKISKEEILNLLAEKKFEYEEV
ncbi:MAG: heavy-metal-associated domain-containing protein [Malacoplasma sp.]|nr:heavy-metal-associated domain-containing protein [Malacoplasma sp.]